MEPYNFRIFVCTNLKEGGKSCCTLRGAEETFNALKAEFEKRGIQFDVKATKCGCLGLCENGPNAIVYPGGNWYSGLTADLVEEFVETQIVKGEKFKEKAWDESELKKFFEEKKARKKAEALQKK